MSSELEKKLARELHEVAAGLDVPPMPALALEANRPARVWPPLLVAAAVVLVFGVLGLALTRPGDAEPQPAPSPTPLPSGTPSASPTPQPTFRAGPPAAPYVLDQQLFVDGQQVPGTWWSVEARGGAWVAVRDDLTWWWGRDTEALRIEGQLDQPPVLSPDGRHLGYLVVEGDRARPAGFDTDPGGEGFGTAPVDLPRTEDGVAPRVRAVTDDGDVIVQGTRTSLMWRALTGDAQTVVDLSETAPDQQVLDGTAAGLVVVDGSDGAVDATGTEPYLADIGADGRLTETATLPTYDDLSISPDGTRWVRVPAGTLGGEVSTVASLSARSVTGGDEVTLGDPDGGGFAVGSWVWEDDETLLAVALPADGAAGAGRLVRCSVPLGECRAFAGTDAAGEGPETANAEPAATTEPVAPTAEATLAAVIDAVAAGDRSLLADPGFIDDAEWSQLVDFAAGEGGAGGSCRDNGGGTRDCGISLDADPARTYYAILEPADTSSGWRVMFVSIAAA